MDHAVLDAPTAPAATFSPPGAAVPVPAPPRRLVPRRRRRCREADPHEMVVEAIAQHAESVLRVARRYTSCHADAEDVYQRTLEIFVRKAELLDLTSVGAWLRTVAKHEALALHEQRRRYVGVIDERSYETLAEPRHLPTLEERTERLEELTRAAEALRQLKPQERTALMLRAQGLSYAEIAERQSWTYTKVNRCVTEGRRALLQRMEGLRTGAECARWAPVLSAMADGEATAEQLLQVRPHLRNCSACRAVLGGMERATAPVAALLPIGGLMALPAAAATEPSSSEQGAGLLSRLGDLLVGVQDRVTAPALKAQSALEAFSASKAVAVVASTAAVAGGGVAVERTVADRPADPAPAAAALEEEPPAATPVSAAPPATGAAAAAPSAPGAAAPAEDADAASLPGSTAAAEFGVGEEEQAQREFAAAAARSGGEFEAAAADDEDEDGAGRSTGDTGAGGETGQGTEAGGGTRDAASSPSSSGAGSTTSGTGTGATTTTVPATGGAFESGARPSGGAFESGARPATSTPPARTSGGGEFTAGEFGG